LLGFAGCRDFRESAAFAGCGFLGFAGCSDLGESFGFAGCRFVGFAGCRDFCTFVNFDGIYVVFLGQLPVGISVCLLGLLGKMWVGFRFVRSRDFNLVRVI